jgi:nicotinamidase-related amidase
MASIVDKAEGWMREIEDYNNHSFRLSKMHTALLVIDMQNFFVHEDGEAFIPQTHEILENIQALLKLFRSKKLPVIYTSHSHKSSEYDGGNMTWWWDVNCIEGSHGAEIFEAIKPLPEEKIISKHRYSAFEGTDLDMTLRCLGVTDLVVTGVMTNMCCETTTRDAFGKNYRVQFLCDATATSDPDLQLATLKNIAFGFAPVVLTEDVLEQLG